MGRSTQDVQRHCPPPDSLFLRWELLGRSPRPVRHRLLQRRRRLQSLALRLQQRRCRGPDRLRPGRYSDSAINTYWSDTTNMDNLRGADITGDIAGTIETISDNVDHTASDNAQITLTNNAQPPP